MTDPATQSAEWPMGFGKRYAVLNLDLMSVLIDAIQDSAEGGLFSKVA